MRTHVVITSPRLRGGSSPPLGIPPSSTSLRNLRNKATPTDVELVSVTRSFMRSSFAFHAFTTGEVQYTPYKLISALPGGKGVVSS